MSRNGMKLSLWFLFLICLCVQDMSTVPLDANSQVNGHSRFQESSSKSIVSQLKECLIEDATLNPFSEDISNDIRLTGGFILSLFIVTFLATLGGVGNLVNLVVWSAESGFKPTTFLFKALAVSDIVNLVSIVLFVFDVHGVVSIVSAALSSTVSAHTTMAIAYARWLTVKQPTRVKTLLPKYRVIVSYVLLLTWCCLTWLPPFLTVKRYMRSDQRIEIVAMVHSTIAGTLSLVLPVVVTVCLNVGLINKMQEHTHSSHLGQQQRRATRAPRVSTLARSVTCVVCTSVTTILAYPLAFVIFAMNIYSNCGVYKVLGTSTLKLLLKVSVLSVMFNASINVVYYLLFSSHFRQLLRGRLHCCVCRNDPPRDIPLNRIVA